MNKIIVIEDSGFHVYSNVWKANIDQNNLVVKKFQLLVYSQPKKSVFWTLRSCLQNNSLFERKVHNSSQRRVLEKSGQFLRWVVLITNWYITSLCWIVHFSPGQRRTAPPTKMCAAWSSGICVTIAHNKKYPHIAVDPFTATPPCTVIHCWRQHDPPMPMPVPPQHCRKQYPLNDICDWQQWHFGWCCNCHFHSRLHPWWLPQGATIVRRFFLP